MKVVKIEHEGKQVDAESLEFKTNSEPWQEYELSDGTTVRIRTMMVAAFRLLNERRPDGGPIHVIQNTSTVNIQVGAHLLQDS